MSGFMNPETFKADLEKVIDNPTPENEAPAAAQQQEAEAEENLEATESEEVSQEEEQEAAGQEQEGGEEDNSPRIPRSRLNKEIEKRRILEEDSRIQREEYIKTKTRLEAMEAALEQMFGGNKKGQEAQEEAVNENIDPLDQDAHKLYMKQIKTLEQKIEQLSQGSSQIASHQAVSAFQNAVNTHTEEFRKQQPDVEEAYKYIIDLKKEEKSLLYTDPKQAEIEAIRDMQVIAAKAWQKGDNMAEVVYGLAKRAGYQPKDAKPAQKGANLAAIEQNMKKSSSIGNIPSAVAAPGGGFDLDKMRKKEGGMIDPKQFHRALQRELQARGA